MMSDGNQDTGYSRNGSVLCDSHQHLPELLKDHTVLGVIHYELPMRFDGVYGIGYTSDRYFEFSFFALHSQLLRQIQTNRPSY